MTDDREPFREARAAEIERIEYAIAAKTPCRCGHPIDHHDAGECWTTPDGRETWGETSCRCGGYEPKPEGIHEHW